MAIKGRPDMLDREGEVPTGLSLNDGLESPFGEALAWTFLATPSVLRCNRSYQGMGAQLRCQEIVSRWVTISFAFIVACTKGAMMSVGSMPTR